MGVALPVGSNTAAHRRLLVDVTRTVDSGLHSGIQRVVRGLYRGCQAHSAQARISVHAVRCEGRHWIDIGDLEAHPLEMPADRLPIHAVATPTRIEARPGDTLLLADAAWYLDPWPAVDAVLEAGGRVAGFVHDLLPMRQPDWFRPGTGALFHRYMTQLNARASALMVSSDHIAGQLRVLKGPDFAARPPVTVIPLASSLTAAEREPPSASPFYLAVATLEPRKNHALMLDAFEALWRAGSDARLLLVGAPGWCNDPLLRRIETHAQLGERLQWLRDVDDQTLAGLYRGAQALLYLPDDEGFGLPVLEAREQGCAVIASDIAPLREAGGDWPRYIPVGDRAALLQAIEQNSIATPIPGNQLPRRWEDAGRELLHALELLPNDCAAFVTATATATATAEAANSGRLRCG